MENQTTELYLNLWRYMSPVVLVVGLIGNILSLLVMRFTSMKYTTLSIYLSMLAVSDIGLLIFGLGPNWGLYVHQFNLRATHAWVCKFHALIVHCCRDLSAWMLVCVTLERLVIVYRPMRAKILFTSRRTILTIFVVMVTLVLINCHFLVNMTVTVAQNATAEMKPILYKATTQNQTFHNRTIYKRNETASIEMDICQNFKYSEGFYSYYWTWIDGCVASFFPFTLIFICNLLIVIHLIKAESRRNIRMNVINSSSDDATKSMTVTLIAISIVFLLLTAPAVIVLIAVNLKIIKDPTYELTPDDKLLITVGYMLEYSNCA
ncbi:unnamed protein product [Owenia fusiformis]|uniref:Uncharacterized protein n=1 Tax=Owenia fusiformis TaxID=6347 RepID=A0A8J1UUY8_OWEFU|nr:unnamed protein product [Owenia fusiformis]